MTVNLLALGYTTGLTMLFFSDGNSYSAFSGVMLCTPYILEKVLIALQASIGESDERGEPESSEDKET